MAKTIVSWLVEKPAIAKLPEVGAIYETYVQTVENLCGQSTIIHSLNRTYSMGTRHPQLQIWKIIKVHTIDPNLVEMRTKKAKGTNVQSIFKTRNKA